MFPLKLRTKLALSYATLFVTLLGSSGMAVYQLMTYRLRAAADDNLVDHVAGLWGYIEFHGDRPAIKFDARNPYVTYFLLEATRYYQIYDAHEGRILLESEGSSMAHLALDPGAAKLLASDPGIDTRTHNKMPVRFRSALFEANGSSYLLRVGVSIEHDLTDLAELRNVLLLLLPITTSFAVFGAWWMAGRTLRPVRDLEKEASEISIVQLNRRLPDRGSKDELDSLARTFNRVLSRLEASVRQMRSFADFMAHELRTPMTVLRGEIEVESMRPDLPQEWRKHLQSHLEEFGKLQGLINRFLLVAKAETGGIHLQNQPLHLSDLLRSIAKDLEPLANNYGVKLSLTGDTGVKIFADPGWIERAFMNLIANALKFTPGAHALLVHRAFTHRHSPLVRSAVADPRSDAAMQVQGSAIFGVAGHGLRARHAAHRIANPVKHAAAVGFLHAAHIRAHAGAHHRRIRGKEEVALRPDCQLVPEQNADRPVLGRDDGRAQKLRRIRCDRVAAAGIGAVIELHITPQLGRRKSECNLREYSTTAIS